MGFYHTDVPDSRPAQKRLHSKTQFRVHGDTLRLTIQANTTGCLCRFPRWRWRFRWACFSTLNAWGCGGWVYRRARLAISRTACGVLAGAGVRGLTVVWRTAGAAFGRYVKCRRARTGAPAKRGCSR